ncbi:hypothetical protein DKX15_21545, partial [Enterococcus faecium]
LGAMALSVSASGTLIGITRDRTYEHRRSAAACGPGRTRKRRFVIMATDRVSLIHFDKLSMSPAAADRFQKALDALEALK